MTIKSKSSLLRAQLLCLLLLVTSVLALGQDQPLRIKYWLAMSHPNSHLFEVNIEIDVPADAKLESLDFQMPKCSPGRYAVFDFAKNVQEVRAESRCPPNFACEQIILPITRADDQTLRVQIGGFKLIDNIKRFKFSYKVFANDLSGTFSELDSRHANFNGGLFFFFLCLYRNKEHGGPVHLPAGWGVSEPR